MIPIPLRHGKWSDGTVGRWLLLGVLVVMAIVLRFAYVQDVKMSGDESTYYYLEALEFEPGNASPEWMTDIRFHFDRPIHQADLGRKTPHPMVPVLLMGVGAGIADADGAGARVVNGLLGLAVAACLFVAVRQAHGLLPAVFVFGLAALMPLAVRLNRTLYLDSAFALGWTALAVSIVQACDRSTWRTSLMSGVALSSVISSKTSGLLAIPFCIGCFLIAQRPQLPLSRRLRSIAVVLSTAMLLSLLLNDPVGYFRSVLNPVDPDYQGRSLGNGLWYAMQPVSLRYLAGIAAFQVTLPVTMLALAGISWIVLNWGKAAALDRVALLGLGCLLPVIPLHLPGISAEHGYLVFAPFLSLLAVLGFCKLTPERRRLGAVVLVLAVMVPMTIIYGWRLSPLPYPSYLNKYDFGQAYYDFDRTPLMTR